MKISLSTVEGISVLTGAGEVSAHDIDVLRAGLTKLLKSGRNRIILEFPESERVPDTVLRELSKFDILARELSGRIVLSGSNDKFRKRVLQFAEPPVIECFDGKDLALKYFREKSQAKIPLPQAPATPVSPGDDPKRAAKADIRQKELTNATDLRKRISELENENKLLQKELHAAWLASRPAATQQAQQGELDALRQRIGEILEETKATRAQ